jgi:hypothetical protein
MQASTTCSIPATAQAYSLNITVVPPGPLSYITVWPTGQNQPVVSTLNDQTGTIVANAAIVPSGTSGSINVYASQGTDIIIDINGYYAASFGTPSGGYQFPSATGMPLMTIAPTGNVGIGTATPGSALDVVGDINFGGSVRFQGNPVLQVPGGLTTANFSSGVGSLASNTSGIGNTAIGDQALTFNTTGSYNTATGPSALYFNATGTYNTALGGSALRSNTFGSASTAVGWGALYTNNAGSNVAVGFQTLYQNTGGMQNTAIGSHALLANTVGNYNTAVGAETLGANTTGQESTATGGWALFSNTTGGANTASGYYALFSNTTGSNNIAIGYQAAMNVSGTNSNNIHIGTQGASGDNGTIRIGGNTNLSDSATQTQFFASGIRGTTTTNNDAIPVVIDSAGQLGTVSSSRRYKEDIQDMGDASSGLMRLRPVTFRYQKPFADGSKPIQYGLIAEEVAEVYPNLVARSADGQIETVKYQVLDSMLLNEVQRLNKENQSLQQRLERLEAAMASVVSTGVQ